MPVAPQFQHLFDYCEEILDSRHGTPWEAGGKRAYVRKWRVRLKDRTLGANVICKAPGVAPYAPYATEDGKEYDYQALCVRIYTESPEDPQDRTHHIVVAEYSTEMPDGGAATNSTFGIDGNGSTSFPWLEPPHIEFDSEVHREAQPRDLDGKAYLNAARQPFRPAPSTEVGRTVMIYARNEQSHNPRKQTRYSFAVNSDTFLGERPGTVMLYPPRAVLSWRGRTSFWRVTYRFRFNSPEPPQPTNRVFSAATGNPVVSAVLGAVEALNTPLRTWQPRLLNCGLMQVQNVWQTGPSAGLPIPIFRGGAAVTEPVLLTEKGREMKPDENGNWPDPIYLEFRQYLALPFTPLLVGGLGIPF